MRDIKFEYGFYNHAPLKLTLNELDSHSFYLEDKGRIKYKRQYTGLKDKNGVDIYEGDIIRLIHKEGQKPFDGLYVSEFEDGCFMFREHYKGIPNDWIGTIRGTPMEVIGNIYENPELLS